MHALDGRFGRVPSALFLARFNFCDISCPRIHIYLATGSFARFSLGNDPLLKLVTSPISIHFSNLSGKFHGTNCLEKASGTDF
jgi:hypothetical protein